MSASATLRLFDTRQASDAQLAPFMGWLAAPEMARYHAFVRAERRRQFVAGRVLARQMLGAQLGVAPASLALDAPSGAKPQLLGAPIPIHFSISHSGPWVACAVGVGSDVGLDIERLDPKRDLLALAAQAFGEAERAALAAMDPAPRLRAFYRMWSGQEAWIKLGAPAVHSMDWPHAELAIVLCAAHALEAQPALHTVDAL